jgi:hypothetical protein
MNVDNAADDAFNAGFNDDATELTTTPEKQDAAPEQVPEQSTQADQSAQEPAGKLKPAPPEYAQITKQEYESLKAQAASLDELKTSHSQAVNSLNGKYGSMKQMIDRLQASTEPGQKVLATIEDFKELVDEGYPDLAEMQMAGVNRVLSRLNVRGTGDQPSAAPAFDEAKAKEIFGAEFKAGSEALREQIRYEMAKDALTDEHDDWEKVINAPEFTKWRTDNSIDSKKDRKGIVFAESQDPRFISKVISDFKAAQKQTAARQSRLSDAVTPKGAGGHGTGQSEVDEFTAGFNS